MLINLKLLTTANSYLQNMAEHENFSATKYENANSYLLAGKISCSAQLNMKNSFVTLGPDLFSALVIAPEIRLFSTKTYS